MHSSTMSKARQQEQDRLINREEHNRVLHCRVLVAVAAERGDMVKKRCQIKSHIMASNLHLHSYK